MIALTVKELLGLYIQNESGKYTWDWFWQTLPASALQMDCCKSIYYLHAQPPLYNLIGAGFIKCFAQNFLEAIHYFHIFLGGLMSACVYFILLSFSRSRSFSLLAAMVLAIHPALFLYQSYALYTILAAFLVIAALFFLIMHQEYRRDYFLLLFLFSLNLLVLTRSVFHIVLLFPALALVALICKRKKRIMLFALLISLLSISWYIKNEIQFGFFAGSSWGGLGLWKITMQNYTPEEMQEWVDKGVVDECVADHYPFTPPAAYEICGFSRKADPVVLSQNDYNNINIIDISRLYQRNALRLIRHDPIHYLKNCIYAFIRFTRPSSQFKHLGNNRVKIHFLDYLYADILQGQFIKTRLRGIPFSPVLFLLLPTGMLFFFILLLKTRPTAKSWIKTLNTEAPLLFVVCLVIYTILVGSMLEYGENARFKFLIEMPLWSFLLSLPYIYNRYTRLLRTPDSVPNQN